MPSLRHLLGVVCVLVAACGSESAPPPKPPDAFSVFPNLPLPPDARFVSRTGSEDALQVTLFTPTPAAKVVEYYRVALSQGKWRLVSDMKKPDGKTVLYAEQDGPPLWVSVWPTSDSAGTMVQLAGAVVRSDSAKAAAPKPQATGS
jgi:hypothetical protein